MEPADITSGGISILIGLVCGLYGLGMLPIGSHEQRTVVKICHGDKLKIVCVVMVLMGVAKLFGVMR